jgi:hypothetical protein
MSHPSNVDLLHHASRVISVCQYPRHIREQQQLLSSNISGNLTRRSINIDVVDLSSFVDRHSGDDRDVAGHDDGVEDGGVDARDLANEADSGGVSHPGDDGTRIWSRKGFKSK